MSYTLRKTWNLPISGAWRHCKSLFTRHKSMIILFSLFPRGKTNGLVLKYFDHICWVFRANCSDRQDEAICTLITTTIWLQVLIASGYRIATCINLQHESFMEENICEFRDFNYICECFLAIVFQKIIIKMCPPSLCNTNTIAAFLAQFIPLIFHASICAWVNGSCLHFY